MSILDRNLHDFSNPSHTEDAKGWVVKREIFIDDKLEGSLLFLDGQAFSFCKYDGDKLTYQYFAEGKEQYFDDTGKARTQEASPETKQKYGWAFDKLINYAKLPKGKLKWYDYQGFYPDKNKPFLSGMQDENGKITEKDGWENILGKGNKRRWIQKCSYDHGLVEAQKNNGEISKFFLDGTIYRRPRANNNNIVYKVHHSSHDYDYFEVSPTGLVLKGTDGNKGFRIVSKQAKIKELSDNGAFICDDGTRCEPTTSGLKITSPKNWSLEYDMAKSYVTRYNSDTFNYHRHQHGSEEIYHNLKEASADTKFSITGNYDLSGNLVNFKGHIDKNSGFFLEDENYNAVLNENGKPDYAHSVYEFDYDAKTELLTTECMKRYYEHHEPYWTAPKDHSENNIFYAKLEDLSLDNLISGNGLAPQKIGHYTFEYDNEPKLRKHSRMYKDGEPFDGIFEEVNEDGSFVIFELKKGKLVKENPLSEQHNEQKENKYLESVKHKLVKDNKTSKTNLVEEKHIQSANKLEKAALSKFFSKEKD